MRQPILLTLLCSGYGLLTLWAVALLTLPLPPSKALVEQRAAQYDLTIYRDNYGIPHIYGKQDLDTAFGLGYAQSEDDFTTLQTVILATRGMLAAENGYSAAKTDFVVQFMGVWQTIDSHYEDQVPENIKQIAQAYADGVNLFAVQNPEKVSPYLLPVTPQDLIAGFTFKTPMFYGFDDILAELVNSDKPMAMAKTEQHALEFVTQEQPAMGSQGIAIAPKRSDDGATRLLVNSHQPLTGPVAWYEARLHSEEGLDVVGSTFPGAPVIIHGHNRDVGWANTVNKPDLVDIYKLTINPDNENEYWMDGKWHRFEQRTAKITIGILGPLRLTINKSIQVAKHGPVMETDHGHYALRWAGMNEVRTLEFMYGLNKASNQSEFESMLAMNAMPSINYVYADKQGNIAHYYNAMFPKRIEGWDWGKVLPGDNSDLIWDEYLGFSAVPKTVNPESGFVYNANNTPFMATDGLGNPQPANFSKTMGIQTEMTNRALRIDTLAKEMPKISLQNLKDIKFDLMYDSRSHQVKQLKLWMNTVELATLTPKEQQAKQALASWNYGADRNNELAALAILTLQPIEKANNKQVPLDEITQAFKNAVAFLYEYHGHYKVAYGDVVLLIRGDKNLAVSGGPDILRAIYTHPANESGHMEARAGDGFMMFVEWNKQGLVSSEAIHQFGAATNQKHSTHYNDQMDMFVEHKLRPVVLTKSQLMPLVLASYHPLEK
ncbi:penicillin acylase family protein [Bermanella sp. R86510]|uniref:penicillin acylase family protein n=1 Tax=unclassified Bermanella TaxID=2627862 RepID=UPI0037CB64D5